MESLTSHFNEPFRATALLPALLVALGGFGIGGAAFYAPPATGEMAVIFAPWVDEPQALAAIIAAGGSLAGSTRLGNIAVAYASDAGFAERIRAHGGLFTLSATALCGTLPPADGDTA